MLVSSPFRQFVQQLVRSFPSRRRPSRRRRFRTGSCTANVPAIVESLENRQLLSASVLVTSAAAAANYASNVTISQLNASVTPVTLRDAVNAVNNTPGAATISFDSSVFASGQTTINVTGGPLDITNTTGKITIQGSTADQISLNASGLSRVFQIEAGVNAEIDNLTITGGMASLGAGIDNLGTLTLNSDTIVGNNANASASVDLGAGIANSGNLNIANTTITGNTVSGGATLDAGGGIYTSAGNVIIVDSTIANNTVSSSIGSAIGGGIAWAGGSTIKLNGSILAGNTAINGVVTSTSDFSGSAANIDASASFNLIGDGTNTGLVNGVNGNLVGGSGGAALNAGLLALGNFGGAVQTQALATTSAAVGAGAAFNDANGNPITVDARGVARVAGSIDIGAYQSANPIVTAITRVTPTVYATTANSVTFGVAFDVPVQNVDATDFTVNAGSITNVSAVDSSHYTVTVGGLGAFTGNLALDFSASQNITDLTGLPLLITTPTVTINNTFAIDHSTPVAFAFTGNYAVNAGGPLTLGTITQVGAALTLNGSIAATVLSPTTISVGGVLGTYADGKITFGATGAFANQVWTKLDLPVNFTTHDGLTAHVAQNGLGVTFTDQFGNASAATWITPTTLSVFGGVATIANGEISFTDGTVWKENVSVTGALNGSGTTMIAASQASVSTTGNVSVSNYINVANNLSQHAVFDGTSTVGFFNGRGAVVLGTFINANQVLVSAWNNDVATINSNGTITWSDGAVWSQRITGNAALTVTDYANVANATDQHLVRSSSNVGLFINGHGAMALGVFSSATQATVAAWGNDVVNFAAGQGFWSDGAVWAQVSPGAFVTSTLYVNAATGVTQELIQNGSTLIFANSLNGHTSFGVGAALGNNMFRISAFNNDVATLNSNGTISFSDGSLWVQTANPQVAVTLTDATGATFQAGLVDSNTLIGLNGRFQGVTGTLLNGKVFWSNGEVWDSFSDQTALDALFEMRSTFP